MLILNKVGKTSNGSYNIVNLASKLPLQMRFKKLLLHKKWLAGRASTGRITVFTKGPKVKKVSPVLNYNFRCSGLFFIAGLNYTSSSKIRVCSLTFTSTGLISYLPTSERVNFFFLNKLQSLSKFKSQFYKELLHFKPFIELTEIPFMLIQQKKNSSVSFIELSPLEGSKYARSIGSSASIVKLDTRTGLSLVKLPSGVKKVFSAFSLSHAGPASMSILKNQLPSTKSGY